MRKTICAMPPGFILIDDHALGWRRVCELRSRQLEAWRKAQPQQPVLFELREDCRPAAANPTRRYAEPGLLASCQSQ